MKTYTFTAKKAIEFLKEGHALTQTGLNLNTMTYDKKSNLYKWVGKEDKGPTFLEEKELNNKLFLGEWVIDL